MEDKAGGVYDLRLKLQPLKDDDLVKKSQKGDKIAFEVLMERHAQKLRPIILKAGALSAADMEDVLQKTYLKCWRKIGTFKFKSQFGTWLFRVLRNTQLDFIKQEKRKKDREVSCDWASDETKKALDFISDDDILFNIEREERAKAIRVAFSQVKKELSSSHVRVIELVIIEEMTYREAAEEMGCPLGTVMSRLFLARKKAQKILKRYKLR